LIGHIIIGLRMIDEKIRAVPDFPERLRTLLHHMILSHHGELEFGSPKVPLFPEALLLHHIDNMDSKMECMRAFIEKDRLVDGCWTSYVSSLDRSVLKKRKYLEQQSAPVPVPAPNIAEPPQPAPPQTQQQVAAASPQPYSRPISPFAEKLKGALGGGS
jgi:3'-5' exoribonuclease